MINKLILKMFEDICMANYTLDWELQHSYFLRDCLYEEISYELKESRVIIYKELDNGISEEITLDELIFYIHSEVAAKILSISREHTCIAGAAQFRRLFTSIDNIKKAVGNMGIILKYDDEKDKDDENDGDDNDGGTNKSQDNKTQDNKSLAF